MKTNQYIETGIKTRKKNSFGIDSGMLQNNKAVFESSPESIILIERNGNITDVNRKVIDWLGYEYHNIIGVNVKQLPFLPYKSKIKMATNLLKKIGGEKIPPYEIEFTDINSNTKLGRISTSIIKNSSGSIIQIMVFISDVTKAVAIEKEFLDYHDQLKAILSVSSDIMILMDRDFKYRAVSSAFYDYMNLHETQVIGKTDFDLYPNEEAERFRQIDIAVLSSGDKWEEDCEIVDINGTKKWLHVIKAPIFDNSGNVSGILKTIRDITARKVAENKLLQQKDFMDKMFESSATGLMLVDNSKNIVRINDSALKILGKTKNELINSRACSLFNCPSIGEHCNKLHKGKKIVSAECHAYGKKGFKGTPVLKSVIKIENGNETFLLESFVDITKRKNMEEELVYHKNNLEKIVLQRTKELEDTNVKLLRAKNKAEESDKLKSAFLANMSHEIRTPMNIILGFGELLLYDNSLETQQEYINNINKTGNHLLDLINDIVDVSKLEAGLVNINNSKFIIEEKLDSLYKQFSVSEKCQSGKVSLILDNKLQDRNTTIFSDKVLFNQVLINLLNNAIKFTNEGSVHFGFHMIKQGDQEFYEFYVKDTGIGMTDSDRKIIFDRFRQVDYKDKRNYGGTGLGLSICKANANLLGGEMNVESIEGKGSIFKFTIPVDEKVAMKLQTEEIHLSM